MPTAGQLILLCVAIVLLSAAMVISLLRARREHRFSRLLSKICVYCGLTAALAVLVWHAVGRSNWVPLDDNFESLIWLALLLGVFLQYVQRRRPLGPLDWFILPIVILLLAGAVVFGAARPHEYLPQAWWWIHRVTAYGGAVAFAIACAVGCMYLIANRRLRRKVAIPGTNLGSLERLEYVTMNAVTMGFALLTLGAVTGIVLMIFEHRATTLPKVVLTAAVWIAYALALHSPMNPSFRGRRSAILSIVGFVLMIGTIVAVQFMPETAQGH